MKTKKRSRRIPIPREVMADFKKWSEGSPTRLEHHLRGYRRTFRQRVAAGETPAQIHASVKRWRKQQSW